MQVKITLTPDAREAAIEMRRVRGIATPDDFEGPEFPDVKDIGYSDHYFSVYLADGNIYAYPHLYIA